MVSQANWDVYWKKLKYQRVVVGTGQSLLAQIPGLAIAALQLKDIRKAGIRQRYGHAIIFQFRICIQEIFISASSRNSCHIFLVAVVYQLGEIGSSTLYPESQMHLSIRWAGISSSGNIEYR